ncbi:M14 family zinc carboxypeptidase [uncultured Abyssibacter sp.]|uniref:M14 family zinc carboxypeptidase n=1 Tax=uncultured Abyssibacter sp. TaxID=2320202 RepID=UPI0032B2FFE6
MAWRLVALLAAVVAGPAAATVQTYVESNAGSNEIALGYPVPEPVGSVVPVDGFRDYSSLQARHRDLAGSPVIREVRVGTTLEGRPIWAYVVGDADARLADGSGSEGVVLFNGGIHAREWASPEVSTAVLEALAAGAEDGGFIEFLVDQVEITIVPVLNVDGFVQTQRTPTQVLRTTFSGDPSNWPRDGRMRRKNMRGVDTDLTTESDGMRGVDVNRNSNPFWATSSRSSGNSASLVYHGAGPASEPETQAIQAAAELVDADRLRFFVDIHSFSRVFFAADTGNTRRDAIARELANTIRAATSGYDYDPTPAGVGIGALDEYFAYTYQVPSYTLEIEPGPNGSHADYYGSIGVTHDGFILPEAEIARVREELTDALLLGAYRQSGPPVALAATLRSGAGAIVYDGAWQPEGAEGRAETSTRLSGLPTGELELRIRFDRPMRLLSGSTVVQYRGQSGPPLPDVRFVGLDADGQAFEFAPPASAMQWSDSTDSTRYTGDTLNIALSVTSGSELATASRLDLVIDAQDLSGQRLDANPSTVATWTNGAWSAYEDEDGRDTDQGGASPAFRLIGDGLAVPTPVAGGDGGGSGGFGVVGLAGWLGLLLLTGVHRRRKFLSASRSLSSSALSA